ncbi:MAG: integrase [Proteobacteria bacterium]|nr:integrase [Pseudomonadota bacterium]
MNPAMVDSLLSVFRAADQAGHGNKEAVYTEACQRLGMTRATLLRKIKEVAVKPTRKRRDDAGDVSLSREEAVIISALLMESLRKNNKRLLSIGQAVSMLRANGEVRAERVDPATGECILLSDSAIARALRTYGLHPDQLLRAAPAVELRSLHPNHVWQIDASLCVLYYLNARTAKESGLQVMERAKFYKNKPANLKRIEADRVWSYEVTDHNSGAIFLNYVMGAESAANLAESFILAIEHLPDDPHKLHGVPYILMMDMGSANTSGAFANLTRRLQVQTIPHAPENARATGQVENARNIIERSFESGLRFQPVASLEELNAAARKWARWYNATKEHSRHGKTRLQQWLTINQEQLRIVDADLARRLLTHAPERRKVSDTLTVSFGGQEFDVSSIPRVMVGESMMVTHSPYQPDAALVVDTDEHGHETLYPIPLVQRGDDGFRLDANVIGEDWKRHADTQADVNRKLVNRVAMEAETDEQAEAARKAKALPFGGRIDPWKEIEQTELPTILPRRGTGLHVGVTAATAPAQILTHFAAATELLRRGVTLDVEKNRQIAALYPDGVPDTELDNLAQRLTVRAGLRVVVGA